MTPEELLAVQTATDRGCTCHPEVSSHPVEVEGIGEAVQVQVLHDPSCRLARVDSAGQN